MERLHAIETATPVRHAGSLAGGHHWHWRAFRDGAARIRAAFDDLVFGLLMSPANMATRRPVVLKALLCRALVMRGDYAFDLGKVLGVGFLGRGLAGLEDGTGISIGTSECEGQCPTCESAERLARVEKTVATIDAKLDAILRSLGERLPRSSDSASDVSLMENVACLRDLVERSLADGERMRIDVAYKSKAVDELAEGADKFVAGVVSRMKTKVQRDLFFLLIQREDIDGFRRLLTYEQIGERMGRVTKQAVAARVKDFKHDHREAWQYVLSIRRPRQAEAFSALSPSDRRKHGIDKTYDHETS